MGLNTLNNQAWDNVDLSTDQTTAWFDTRQVRNAGITFKWANGSSLSGELFVQGANETGETKDDAEDVTLSATLDVTGASGTHIVNISDWSFAYIRLRFAASAGSGDGTARFVLKGER